MLRVDDRSDGRLTLKAEPISAAAFAPYGALVEWPAAGLVANARPINEGSSQRLDWPRALSLTASGGQPTLALFRAKARAFPFRATGLEVHRRGSQTFAPLGVAAGEPAYVVLVAQGAPEGSADLATLRAFVCQGHQAVNLAPGTWHHALLALREASFLVVERSADQADCDLTTLPSPVTVGL
jgi:ureidoglycolate lyase